MFGIKGTLLTANSSLGQILQQEKLSLETCLKVIKMSSEQLSIKPKMSERKTNITFAEFLLSDGIMIIKCDAVNGLMTVYSKK